MKFDHSHYMVKRQRPYAKGSLLKRVNYEHGEFSHSAEASVQI